MVLVFDSHIILAHDLGRLDLPACIYQQLLGIYRRLAAFRFLNIPLILRLGLV